MRRAVDELPPGHERWRADRLPLLLLAVGLSAVVGLAGCDDGSEPDPEVDSGAPETDAGTPGVDAGAPEEDAGLPEADGGLPEEDGGLPETDAGPTTDCPSTGGPIRVRIPGEGCIDSTEVTRAQYQAFLDADVDTTMQEIRCRWNDDFTPLDVEAPGLCDEGRGEGTGVTCRSDADCTATTGDYCRVWTSPSTEWGLAAGPDLPVTNVDYCDAAAFCRWTGGRLCGVDEWELACSADGARDFPYGEEYVSGSCNLRDTAGDHGCSGTCPLVAANTDFPGCEGGYRGIFDMVGNVSEMVDVCGGTTTDGSMDNCLVRGGSRLSSESATCLATPDALPRGTRDTSLGFRCCSD